MCLRVGHYRRGTFVDLIADPFHEATLNATPLFNASYTPETGLMLPMLAEDDSLIIDAQCMYSNTNEGLHRFSDPVDGAVYAYSQFETADAKLVYA